MAFSGIEHRAFGRKKIPGGRQRSRDLKGWIDELIDPERLRSNWLQDRPDFRWALLLQAARLARD
jgi:hypothetical protein